MEVNTVDGGGRLKLQLRKEGNFAAHATDKAVVVCLVVGRTRHIFHRMGDICSVEVIVILSRILRVPDGCIGRCVDYRKNNTGTVGTLTGNDTVA